MCYCTSVTKVGRAIGRSEMITANINWNLFYWNMKSMKMSTIFILWTQTQCATKGRRGKKLFKRNLTHLRFCISFFLSFHFALAREEKVFAWPNNAVKVFVSRTCIANAQSENLLTKWISFLLREHYTRGNIAFEKQQQRAREIEKELEKNAEI